MVSAALIHQHGKQFLLGFESDIPYSNYGRQSLIHFSIRNCLGMNSYNYLGKNLISKIFLVIFHWSMYNEIYILHQKVFGKLERGLLKKQLLYNPHISPLYYYVNCWEQPDGCLSSTFPLYVIIVGGRGWGKDIKTKIYISL